MNQHSALAQLSNAGVSVWLDDLSRNRITSGNLRDLIDTRSVVGVTTNPSIFQSALSHGTAYEEQLHRLAADGADVDTIIRTITTDDVRAACEIFEPVYIATGGVDGRVSIEVDPRVAHDTTATVEQATELWRIVDRLNVLIKIPAPEEGIDAIAQVIGRGISVNVTLIFSVERYELVMNAYLEGLDTARAAGLDLSTIHSVASFFISRVDAEVDARLEAIGTSQAQELKGAAALANARLAYHAYVQIFEAEPRFAALRDHGARPQRPLWASTGVKDPAREDTAYVTGLVAPNTVNTMPEKTLEAFATTEPSQVTPSPERTGIPRNCSTGSVHSESTSPKSSSPWRTTVWPSSRTRGASCTRPPARNCPDPYTNLLQPHSCIPPGTSRSTSADVVAPAGSYVTPG